MTDELTARELVLDAATREFDACTSGLTATGAREADLTAADRRRGAESARLKAVPDSPAIREQIKAACERLAGGFDPVSTVNKNQLEQQSRDLLAETQHPEKYLGFAMVLLGNALWKRSLLAVPLDRRLLLLPRLVQHADGCRPDRTGQGDDASNCAACAIDDLKWRAECLGYQVRVVEESPLVLKSIVAAGAEGILGIARLDLLEKAIDTVLLAGVPSYAVPLLTSDKGHAMLDASWVNEVLETCEPMSRTGPTSYVPLLRAAAHLFNGRFEALLPRKRSTTPENAKSPLGKTEDVAYDWLANGGKRFRPFITLAAYDAATGGTLLSGLSDEPAQAGRTIAAEPISDAVARVAMAIEAFHKASLVHDDIQDDDLFRYGRQTLHRTEGIGPAINIGDYLIGLGYRLVNACRDDLGADVACDILDSMAAAHIKLCDGQGAEMAWQHDPDWEITPADALQIYALKTSPAFEAALFAGLRMGGEVSDLTDVIPSFSRHLGVGFQVLNDLKDWQGDADNKLVAGQDALALRPTVLLAYALESASPEQRQAIRTIYECVGDDAQRITRLRRLFREVGAFEKAEAIVAESRHRAESLANGVASEPIRRLLHFLVDTVLEPEPPPLATNATEAWNNQPIGAR